MDQQDPPDLSGLILPTSATMAGVCVTVIGIFRLVHAGSIGFYVDKLLAVDCVLFVVCSVISFYSVRIVGRARQLENLAESLFLVGLILLGIASVIMTLKVA